jgi:hypothetical protein
MSLPWRFMKGLREHNITNKEIEDGEWKYCGGDQGSHLNYFKLSVQKNKKDTEMPLHVDKCICGHHIEENCFITNGDRIIVLGNCCIKRFVPKSTRTCSECGEPHRNRVVDRCNECRIGICDGCGRDIDIKYKKCYRCFNS